MVKHMEKRIALMSKNQKKKKEKSGGSKETKHQI